MSSTDAVRVRRLQWAIGWAALLFTFMLHAQPAKPLLQSATQPRTVLVMGDSLSAAYGLSAEQGWVALLADRIAKRISGWRVVNASVSGETTTGGESRIIEALVRHRPSVVLIELGANDALRGLPLRETRRHLARMIGASQGIGAKVLLIGMRIPPNYGTAYTAEFERGFRDLSQRFHTGFVPFLLQPIVANRENFQPDNLHPVASAQPALRDHVWPALIPLLK